MNDVVVAHPMTGEAIALATASDAQIAQVRAAMDDMALRLRDADVAIGDEMLSRMDRSAEWTRHVQIGERRYTFTAPSPQAGSIEYDEDLLEIALTELVNDRTIDPETAEKALVREITVTLKVPFGASLNDALAEAEQMANVSSAKSSVKANLPTIKKLLKIEAAVDAIRAAGSATDAGPRKVKFSVSA